MSRFAIVCALSLAALPVMADEGRSSWGVMVGGSNYETDDGFKFDIATLTGRLNYRLNSLLDLEARLAWGDSNSDGGAKLGINWLTGAYAKARWEVIERLYVTGMGGFTAANTTSRTAAGSASETDGGLSIGVGLDFYADSSSGINVEWIRYMDGTSYGDHFTLDHMGVGYFQKF